MAKVDSYSILIVSKYLQSKQDYINLMLVTKKYRLTTEKLRFNPISISNLNLFPLIQTHYLYDSNDSIIDSKQIVKRIAMFPIVYSSYRRIKDEDDIEYRKVIYNLYQRRDYRGILFNGITMISEKCFLGCPNTTILIPTTVTSLGPHCFSQCEKLQSITIPSSIKIIPKGCFEKSLCHSVSLEDVYIIEDNAFNGCSKLRTIQFSDSSRYHLLSIGKGCFSFCFSLSSFCIPPSISFLPENCFASCFSLQSITIPQNVTSIGKECFIHCHSLSSISLPYSLKRIEERSFEDCSSLVSIVIPHQVSFIDKYSFFNCSSLEYIQLSSSLKLLSKWCFSNCLSLEHIDIPSSISSLDRSTFDKHVNIHSNNDLKIITTDLNYEENDSETEIFDDN